MANVKEAATIDDSAESRPQRVTAYGRDPADGTLRPVTETGSPVVNAPVTVSATAARPGAGDTTQYAQNDAWSNSTSAPTAGGYTITGAARASGGAGTIMDAVITSTADPATNLQGEIWVFDQAVTAINDNAAFALSDADLLNIVVIIPFTLVTTVAGSGTNSVAIVSGINTDFVCVGSANLRFLVKVKNAYTPISAESLQVRLKIRQTN